MSQTFVLLDGGADTLEVSDDKLNAALAALESSFSGASAPTMVAGKLYFNTTDKKMYFNDGSETRVLFDGSKAWGGLLPRIGTADYPMTGDLWMTTGKKIKNVAAPTEDGDAVNLGYLADTIIDGHHHSGLDRDGPQILWNALAGGGTTGNTLIQIAANTTAIENRHLSAAQSLTYVTVAGTGWVDVVSATVYVPANQKKIIVLGCTMPSASSNGGLAKWQLLRGTTVITGPVQRPEYDDDNPRNLVFVTTDTPTVAGNYTYKLQGSYTDIGSGSWREIFLLVL